jgi:hypothetical protein
MTTAAPLTTLGAASSAAPPKRVPLPVAEPPYDDELAGAPRAALTEVTPGQGVLALSFVLPGGLPAQPQPAASVAGGADRVLDAHSADDGEGDEEDAVFAPQPTPRVLLPEPRRWAAQLVQAVIEVIAGDRPATQLIRWTNEEIYATVARRATLGHRARRSGRSPLRAVVRSVRVTEPAEGVAEACALVQRGLRTTAVALRLEGIDGRWQCTALELG